MEFKGAGNKIEQTAETLIRKGIPERAAAFWPLQWGICES